MASGIDFGRPKRIRNRKVTSFFWLLTEALPYRLLSYLCRVSKIWNRRRPVGAIPYGVIHCGDYDANELIEKGAEVFAAEFIYPQSEFADDLRNLGLTVRQASDVVDFKRSCKAKVSYRFISKRLERLGHINPGQFDGGIHFQKLEDQIYGVPFYRRRR